MTSLLSTQSISVNTMLRTSRNSVRHTGDPRLNGSMYRNTLCTAG